MDTDLRVHGRFGSRGSGEGELHSPTAVSCDSAGRVYVADSSNGRVQVFTQDGRFLRSISCRGSGPAELGYPYGVHVDHGWVYVTDRGNVCVSMFTVSGDFITSFVGQDLSSPWGIATDEDDQVYVCDFEGGSIQII